MPTAIDKYHRSAAAIRRSIFVALDHGVELAVEIAPTVVVVFNSNSAIRHRLHSLVLLIVNLTAIEVDKGILTLVADAEEDIVLDVA